MASNKAAQNKKQKPAKGSAKKTPAKRLKSNQKIIPVIRAD